MGSRPLDLDDPQQVRRDDSGRSPAFFSLRPNAFVGESTLDQLEAVARATGALSLRICLHQRPEAILHDMIVLARDGAYTAPHKHVAKDETYHALRGRAVLAFFDDAGNVTQRLLLDPKELPVARVGAGQFHTLLPASDVFVFHESRQGPFEPKGDAVNAPWAPPPADPAAGVAYLRSLLGD